MTATVTFAAGDTPLDLLLIGGVPLNEPIVRYGPFVMNTEEEIRQAVVDYLPVAWGASKHDARTVRRCRETVCVTMTS